MRFATVRGVGRGREVGGVVSVSVCGEVRLGVYQEARGDLLRIAFRSVRSDLTGSGNSLITCYMSVKSLANSDCI